MRVVLFSIGFLVFCVGALPAIAQSPQISVEYEDAQIIVGQPAIVRVKVLVPTFMPTPPVWPSFEAPQMSVRLPERSTSPTSEQIKGETWSGISRTYRLYPMQEGTITMPDQELIVIYADPETSEAKTVTEQIPAIEIVAVIPEGARGLDPLILANKVSASQTIEVDDQALTVGDAIVRKIHVEIEGTSPLFIPPLLDRPVPEAIKPYLQDPKVTEALERGVLSGSRDEQATYVVLSGGNASLPDLGISWYNLETNAVETIILAGQSFDIMAIDQKTEKDSDVVIRLLAAGLLLALAMWLFYRFALTKLSSVFAELRHHYRKSSHFVYRQAKQAATNKDLSGFLNNIDQLRTRGALAPSVREAELNFAVRSLTASLYDTRSSDGQDTDIRWGAASRALTGYWKDAWLPLQRKNDPDLPPLN